MKRFGMLLVLLMFCSFALWAQDNSSTDNNSGTAAQTQSQRTTSTTTTTTTNNDDNGQTTTAEPSDKNSDRTSDQVNNSRKRQAERDDNAATMEKQKAKDASTGTSEDRAKAMARLDSAAADLNQLLAAPDNGIPANVFEKAKCVAVVPDMIKGGFIVGAEHGRGVASCKLANGRWSAPAFFAVTGGNWGAQIGVEGVDLTMLIMNDNGMNQLLSSNWKLGGNASASAGPVGRTAAADTNLKFNSEILTYSRSRGAYAGAVLNGARITPDKDAMQAYYGGADTAFTDVLTGKVNDPHPGDKFTAALHKNHNEVNAEAH